MSAVEICTSQQHLHIGTVWLLCQNSTNLGNGLRIQLALHIHVSKRTACHADLGRLHAITSAIESLQFTLNGRIGRLCFEGTLHMPDGIVQFVLFITDDAHPHMRNKVIGHRHQDTAENIHSLAVAFQFKIRLAKQAIGCQMFGEGP